MNTSRKLAVMITAFTLAGLSACGGGGGGGSTPPPVTPPPPTGGISGNGFAFGPVTTFGSIVVNGVHYDTSTTEFTFDDNPSSEDLLEVGDIVLVKGTINDDGVTGTAATVASDDDVTGPITAGSIDLNANQFAVLGQLVQVTPETSFDDIGLSPGLVGFADGDIVEVHGFFTPGDPGGIDIVATRIENKSAAGLADDEVHGIVSNRTDTTFSLNALVVDYSGALLDNSFPGGLISDGDFVEAKGTSSIIGGVLTLTATSVELESAGISGDDGDHGEVEGFITGFVDSASDFFVAGIQVRTDGGTVVTDAGVASDTSVLGANLKVEVEGELLGDILIADKIDIRRGKAIRAVAIVDSADDMGTADLLDDTVVMLGITFTIDALTRFEDKTNADVTPFTVADIAVGNYLEIRGAEFPVGSGQILAAILERDDPDTRTELQGFVESFDDPAATPTTLTILGVTIDTSTAQFRDLNGNAIADAATFYGLLEVDITLVKVRGTESGDTAITATRVELEQEL